MLEEQTDAVTMKGKPVTLLGPKVALGQDAPVFTALDRDLNEVSLSDCAGKAVLISSVVSVDTGVCADQTQRFSREAADLSDEIVVVTISMDLPFALDRFCAAEGVENMVVLSDHREADFGERYGVLIKELRLLARAIFVIGKDGKIAYREVVPEVTDHPDYESALAAAQEAAR